MLVPNSVSFRPERFYAPLMTLSARPIASPRRYSPALQCRHPRRHPRKRRQGAPDTTWVNATSGTAGQLNILRYDTLNRLNRQDFGTGTAFTLQTYSYDAASPMTGATDNLPAPATPGDQTYGFSYTRSSQIAERTRSNAAYIYDPGSGSGAGDQAAGTTSYARNGLNRYTDIDPLGRLYPRQPFDLYRASPHILRRCAGSIFSS